MWRVCRVLIIVLALWGVGCAGDSGQRRDAALTAPALTAQEEIVFDAKQASGQLEDYLSFATQHHPALAAQQAQWRAASASAQAAYLWPDPMVSYGLMLTPDVSALALRAQQISITQALPWPYRPGLMRQAALEGAKAQELRISVALLMVRAELAQGYWGLWRLEQQRAWIVGQITVLESLAQVVRGRMEVGRATQAQHDQLMLMLTRQRDALARLEAAVEQGRAQLAASLGVERAGEQDKLPISPATPVVAQLPVQADEELIDAARKHPELLVLEQLITQRRREVEVAQTQGLPDMMFGLTYMQQDAAAMAMGGAHGGSPRGMAMAMVGLKVPIFWSRYQAQVDAAQANELGARARLREAQLRAVAATRSLLVELKDTARQIKLYEGALMRQGQGSLNSALTAYEAQGASFAEVLLAQRELYQIGLELVSLKAKQMQLLAQLERQVGRPIAMRPL